MSDLSFINTKKSIELEKLIFERSWLDYLDNVTFPILSAALIFYGILTELKIPYDGIFTGFLLFILAPLFILFGTYLIYRKIREDDLSCVKTNLSKNQNRQILKGFLKKNNYAINIESNEVIIVVDEHMLSYNGLWRKKYVFIIDDFVIYYNVRKMYPVISPPVLVSHHLLKRDLKEFILRY